MDEILPKCKRLTQDKTMPQLISRESCTILITELVYYRFMGRKEVGKFFGTLIPSTIAPEFIHHGLQKSSGKFTLSKNVV